MDIQAITIDPSQNLVRMVIQGGLDRIPVLGKFIKLENSHWHFTFAEGHVESPILGTIMQRQLMLQQRAVKNDYVNGPETYGFEVMLDGKTVLTQAFVATVEYGSLYADDPKLQHTSVTFGGRNV